MGCLSVSFRVVGLSGLFMISYFLFFLIRPNYIDYSLLNPRTEPSELDNRVSSLITRDDFMTSDGVRLQVWLAGPEDGKPLVLLHGFPESGLGAWKHQIPYFVEQGYRLIVPDQRGYNGSDKPAEVLKYRADRLVADIAELILHHTGVGGRAYVAAHDWGALVAWRLFYMYPGIIEKGAILNVPHPAAMRQAPVSQFAKSWYILFFQLPYSIIRNKIERDDFMFLAAVYTKANNQTYSLYDVEEFRKTWRGSNTVESMINWYKGIKYAGEQPGVVNVPLRIIWGEQDIALDLSLATISKQFCSNCDLHLLPDGSHFVQHDKPDVVNSLLNEHFTSA